MCRLYSIRGSPFYCSFFTAHLGLLALGVPEHSPWEKRERAVFRAAGPSLERAFERIGQTQAGQTENQRAALEVFAALPVVTAGHDTLRQGMINLLSNALRYSQGRAVAVIEVRAEEREREWAVSVRDNGVGFDPRYQDKLFGVFQRLHRQEEFEGNGVGLANVRRIIARHGGTVWAEGRPEDGATSGFTLPKRF